MKHKRKKFDGLNDLILFLTDKIKRRMKLTVAATLIGKSDKYLSRLHWQAKDNRLRSIPLSSLMDIVNLANYNIFLVPKDMDDKNEEVCVLINDHEWQ